MRKILFFVLLFVCTGVSAQSETTYDAYCSFRYVNAAGAKEQMQIKMPDEKGWSRIVDKDGKPEQFKNETECLTYMSQRGWKYVDSYIDKTDTWFIMSKNVKNIDQTYEGIKTDKKEKD